MSNVLKVVFFVWALLAVCQGLRIPDLKKLVDKLMSQHAEDAIPIGIVDKLIRKWEHRRDKIECRQDRDINPELANKMDDLVEISHMNSFNCQEISMFVDRIELEHVIDHKFVNLNPYYQFMNDIHFSKCLYDFYARVNEILSRLSRESRTVIERLAENSNISRTTTGVLIALDELKDPRLLNGRSESVPTYLNQITRSLDMQVAIYMTNHINTLNSQHHETPEQLKSIFIQQYYQLIYEPCDIVYEDLSKWLNYVLLTRSIDDSESLNLQLDYAHPWGQYYTVCTILGVKSREAHEYVYRYFITHLEARNSPTPLTHTQTMNRVFSVPRPFNQEPSSVTEIMQGARLMPINLTIEPYRILEDLNRLANERPDVEGEVDLDTLAPLIELSNVVVDKCSTESLYNRLQQNRIIDEYEYNLENVQRYVHYFNNKQFKLCERSLYIALSRLISYIPDDILMQLEQLRRIVAEFNHRHRRPLPPPSVDLEVFQRSVAAFFHLYKHPLGALKNQMVCLVYLLTKTCEAFRGESIATELISIVYLLRIIDEDLELQPMVMNFLTYESICHIYNSMSYNYQDISNYLTQGTLIMPTSLREVWRTVSKKRPPLSLNWLKS